MRKSFTRLLSLVMFLTLLSSVSMAAISNVVGWPKDDGGAAYSKPTDKILIIFSEAVKAGSGYVRLNDTNGVVRVITATDSRISYAKGDTVVVDFTADQAELMTYTVSVDNGTFKPVATASDASVAYVPTWHYTVGDYTAPTLTDVLPVKDATVGQLTSLKMTFKDASVVLKGTGKVALYKADGNIWDLIDVATKGTVSGTGTTGDPYILTVTPVRALEDNVNYTVTIGAGAVTDNGLRADGKKNSYAGLTDRGIFKFSSKDFTVPGYATDYPKAGTIGVTSFDLLVKTTETGSFYAKEFDSEQTIDATLLSTLTGTTAITATSGVEAKKSFTSGIVKNHDYYVYVVTKNTDVAAAYTDIVGPIKITTIDTDKPLLATVTYVKGDTEQNQSVTDTHPINQLTTSIRFNFNETVKVGAGSILIYKKSDNSVFATIDASAVAISADDDHVAIATLPKVFENHADYYAFIPSTLFKDVYNNFYAGITTTTGWTFTTNDTVAPTVVSFIPVDGAVSVKNSDNIVVKFSEIIDLGSTGATISWFTLQVNGAPATYTWTHSTNNNAFSTVTINPDVDFVSSSVVTLTVSGNVADLAENTLGLSQGIAFIAKDIVGPTMTWKTSSPIAPSTSIVVEYNEPIRLLGGTAITADNLYTIVTLKKDNADGVNVTATYAINADKTQITITPASPWDSKGVYYVAMSSDVEDLLANKCIDLVSDRNKTYTVNDVIPATVSVNVDGKTDVDVAGDVIVSFKEGSTLDEVSQLLYGGSWHATALGSPDAFASMNQVIVLKVGDANGVNVPFTVTSADDKAFYIHATLDGAVTYYIGIGASTKDAGGNVNAAKYATFTTTYIAAPVVATLDPADDKVEVALKAPVTVTFKTDIALIASGSYTNGVTINGTPVTYANLSVTGKVLTITHTDFVKNSAYYVTIASGVVTNKTSGTAFGGITAITGWNFVTVDQTFDAFTLAPDGIVTPDLGDKLVISIPTEKIISGTGNISIKNADTDLLIEQISSTSSKVAITYSGSATTIEITPSAKFVYGANYYVEVDNGAFVDMLGNKIPAIHGKTTDGAGIGTWTFTAVNSPLAVTKVTPNMVENVAVDADIVVTFNRDIAKGTSGNVGFVETNFGEDVTKQTVNYGITSSNLIVSGNTLTIKHADKPFTASSTIFVTLQADAIVAATLASTTTLAKTDSPAHKFFVGDNLPPVATVSPIWDENKVYSQVNTNITITFNEDVLNAGTNLALTNDNVTFSGNIIKLIPITYTDQTNTTFTEDTPIDFVGTVSGRTITIDPTSNLLESKTYIVRIVGGTIRDAQSITHVMAQTDNKFKTVDTTLPVVSATLTAGAKLVNVTAVSVTDANPKSFYYILQKESVAAITASADVKASGKKIDATVAIANFAITDLDAATSYVLYYVAEDTFGNLTAVKTSKVSTTDTVAPVLVSTDPVNGTLDVDNAKSIVLTFDENVLVNTSSTAKIYIKDKATNAIISTLDQAALAASAKKVTLTTGFPALAAVQVYVEIEAGLITDASANPYAGILGSDKLYFTYEDNLAPFVSKFAFTGDDITHVALNSNLVLTFTEAVQAGTANAVLYKGATAIEVFKGTEVAISGSTVTINPTVDFDSNSVYSLQLAAGFVKDLSSIKNLSVAYAAGFTTTLNIAPTVAANPAEFTKGNKNRLSSGNGNGGIVLTFNKDVYLTIAGLKKSLVVLTEADIKTMVSFKTADGVAVPFTISETGNDYIDMSVSITDLKDLTSYALTVGGFKDISGLEMTTKTFNYTTGDGKAPTFIFNPADAAKNVVATTPLTITFSEPVYNWVDVLSSPGVPALFYSPFTNDNMADILWLDDLTAETSVPFVGTFNGTNVMTLTPTKPLISGHVYEYGFDATVTDINGNYVNGDSFTLLKTKAAVDGYVNTYADFTVLDTEKPTFALEVGMVSPEPEATSVPADEDMWIEFNEQIVVGTGSIIIRYEDGTIFQTISGSSLAVSADDDQLLTIAHKNFDSDAVYFVEIGEGVITDKAGNKNVAMTDPTKWTFTTKDTFSLTATVTPVGDNTARTVSLTLSFNKVPSVLVANKFLSIYKEDGTAVYQKAVSDLSIVGKDAIYSGVALDANQAYYARVEAGAFKDASGNAFAGIMDNSWVFSTVDNIAPKVVTLAPKDDATGVDTQTSTFTVTFDRDIAVGTGVLSVRYSVSGLAFEEVNVTAATISGKTLTFKVTKALDANTSFYVLVPAGAVTNTEVTKDAFAGILNTYTWNFSTSTDQSAPTLLTWTPTGTLTDNHPTFVMTYNEDVVLGAGSVKVYKASDNTLSLTIPVTASMVSGKTVTAAYVYDATLKNGLDKNTAYYVLVDAGVVKDAAGNGVVAITDVTKWTFTTGGLATPVVTIDDSLLVKVYPNPFENDVTVASTSELSKIVVSNIAGQVVKEVVNPGSIKFIVPLSELRSGVYFISLYQDGAVIKTVKILKR